MQAATDAVFDARIGDISGRGKLAADMREIWLMQPRFERRTPSSALSLVEQPRFRAGFDFLRLRAESGEADVELARWWEDFSTANEAEREDLLTLARQQDQARRAAGGAGSTTRAASGEAADATAPSAAPPAARKRRRRRKPAGERTAAAPGTSDAPDVPDDAGN
jgi:poly(A) polymerase